MSAMPGDATSSVWPVLHYVVTDEVDAVRRRAAGAGAKVVESPHQTRFGSGAGSRAMTVRDPEGNLRAFGTYKGAAAPAGQPAQAGRPGNSTLT